MSTHPFSRTARVLRLFWDGAPIAGWLLLLGWGMVEISNQLEISKELAFPIALFVVAIVRKALQPVRKFLELHSNRLMVISPIKPLIHLGIWRLLIAGERYFSSEPYSDFAGTEFFGRAFRALDGNRRWRRLEILWRVEALGKPHLAKAARLFLREVNAPIKPLTEEVATAPKYFLEHSDPRKPEEIAGHDVPDQE